MALTRQVADSVIRAPKRLLNSRHNYRTSPCSRTTVRTYRRVAQEPARETKTPNVILGIGGGVGPSAGIGLHNKIIENTLCGGLDQGHFSTIHVSRSSSLHDRTQFLLGQTDINPGVAMAQAVYQTIVMAARANQETAIVTVPCNTFHASAIWNRSVHAWCRCAHCGYQVLRTSEASGSR